MIYAQVPHRIEPELALATPRRVRFTPATQKRRLRTWTLTLVPLALLIIGGLDSVEFDDALLTRGKVTNAHFISKDVYDNGFTSNDPHHNVDSDKHLSVSFGFRANGIEVLGTGTADLKEFLTMKTGTPIVVTYLPENPKRYVQGRVYASQVKHKEADWIIGLGLLALIAVAYIVITERYFWRQWRLLRFGKVIAATVISHHTAESGETATLFVRYEYPDLLGHKVAGTLALSPKRARGVPDGSRISVLCMPDSKEPGTPYALITDAEIVQSA